MEGQTEMKKNEGRGKENKEYKKEEKEDMK